MNERERTMTIKGSLEQVIVEHNANARNGKVGRGQKDDSEKGRTLGVLVSRPCRA